MTLDGPVFKTPYGGEWGKKCSFLCLSRLAVGYTLPSLIWAPGLFSGALWPQHGVDHSLNLKVMLRMRKSCTSRGIITFTCVQQ